MGMGVWIWKGRTLLAHLLVRLMPWRLESGHRLALGGPYTLQAPHMLWAVCSRARVTQCTHAAVGVSVFLAVCRSLCVAARKLLAQFLCLVWALVEHGCPCAQIPHSLGSGSPPRVLGSPPSWPACKLPAVLARAQACSVSSSRVDPCAAQMPVRSVSSLSLLLDPLPGFLGPLPFQLQLSAANPHPFTDPAAMGVVHHLPIGYSNCAAAVAACYLLQLLCCSSPLPTPAPLPIQGLWGCCTSCPLAAAAVL